MINFALIGRGEVKQVSFKDAPAAMIASGLTPGKVDFGTVVKNHDSGVGIIVYQFGLMEPNHHYFSIGSQLYAGNAVLFGFDSAGETIDVPAVPPVMFYKDAAAVEAAIQRGAIQRPQTAINGEIVWQWELPK